MSCSCTNRFASVCATRVSFPSPPLRVSDPSPAKIVSACDDPVIASAPELAFTVVVSSALQLEKLQPDIQNEPDTLTNSPFGPALPVTPTVGEITPGVN